MRRARTAGATSLLRSHGAKLFSCARLRKAAQGCTQPNIILCRKHPRTSTPVSLGYHSTTCFDSYHLPVADSLPYAAPGTDNNSSPQDQQYLHMARTHVGLVAWSPSFWKHVPWGAFGSILAFGICCAALALILTLSDGRPIATWPYPSHTIPVSVLLSLIIGIANLTLAVALGRGYEISWCAQALDGAELQKLRFDIDVQRRISAMFGQGVTFDRFAIAAVFSLLVSLLD